MSYLLGTDAIGRDILSRLMYGARLSLSIGVAVVALSVVVGIVLGLVAGFFRGVLEIAIMRLMDIVLTLPSLLLAIVIVAILGPGLVNAMLGLFAPEDGLEVAGVVKSDLERRRGTKPIVDGVAMDAGRTGGIGDCGTGR